MTQTEEKFRESGGTPPAGSREVRWAIRHPLRNRILARLRTIESKIHDNLHATISARVYSVLIGIVGFVLTITMIPFASVLIGAVLLRRRHWPEIVILSSLGSATGGVVLYLLFHDIGWAEIVATYPDLAQSKAWADVTRWVSAYGVWALLVIAATPLPQTPALIFTAVMRLPIPEVFAALLLGKLVKYSVYGFLAARFPSWFQHLLTADKRDT